MDPAVEQHLHDHDEPSLGATVREDRANRGVDQGGSVQGDALRDPGAHWGPTRAEGGRRWRGERGCEGGAIVFVAEEGDSGEMGEDRVR